MDVGARSGGSAEYRKRAAPHVSVLDERIGSVVFYLAPPLRAAASPDRIDQATIAETVSRIRVEPADAVLAVRDDQMPRFNRLFVLAACASRARRHVQRLPHRYAARSSAGTLGFAESL
jgi:hypothetical protein